ncbi:MAG: nucleotide exchange factor GrpE [Minisyncoccia bacterium]
MDNKNNSENNQDQKNEKTKPLNDGLEIEALKKERDKYINDYQKARADLINYKKEEEERLRGVIKFANERLVKELITILDSFELAIESLENNSQSKEKDKYLKGIYLIKNQLEDVMKKEGLEEIQAEKGAMPDLNQNEIISEVENSSVPPGTIVEVFQKGYRFNGKLIRPVRVAVAKTNNKK